MAKLTILQYPDERLHKVAVPVREVNDEVRNLVRDMAETMYAAPGIGLAATQVDVHLQVIVIDLSESRDQLLVLINPEILATAGEQECEEGCLSVPGIYEKVTRAERITVSALDREGKPFTREADGLLAVCIQHEMDHLKGRVFVERLSRLKQTRILSKLKKAQRRAPPVRAREGVAL
ncbi:MAG TPA: peptide deformylase [Burkholderiales bacterium]